MRSPTQSRTVGECTRSIRLWMLADILRRLCMGRGKGSG